MLEAAQRLLFLLTFLLLFYSRADSPRSLPRPLFFDGSSTKIVSGGSVALGSLSFTISFFARVPSPTDSYLRAAMAFGPMRNTAPKVCGGGGGNFDSLCPFSIVCFSLSGISFSIATPSLVSPYLTLFPSQVYVAFQSIRHRILIFYTPGSFLKVILPKSIKLSKWNHYAAVFDSSSKMKSLYVNGELVKNGIGTAMGEENAWSVQVGYLHDGLDSFFLGYMVDARLYVGVALSVEQVKQLVWELVGYYCPLPVLMLSFFFHPSR